MTKLPQLVYSELESLMAQQAAQYQTKDNVVPMLWQGVLEMDIQVGRCRPHRQALRAPGHAPGRHVRGDERP